MPRVQMDLTEKSFERLKDLKNKAEAGSYSEVMKDALRVYEFVLSKDLEGSKFFIEEAGKALTEIKIFV